jgi:PAS domain S-box-containing protein
MEEKKPFAAFRQFAEQHRPAVVESITQELLAAFRERFASFASFAPEDVREAVDTVVGGYLNAMHEHDPEAVMKWIRERLNLRIHEGSPLEDVIHSVTIYRQNLLRLALQAIAHEIAEAHEATMSLMEVCDLVTASVSMTYRDFLEQYNAELHTFKTLVDNALDGIAFSGTNNKISYCNRSFMNMTGQKQNIGLFPARTVAREEQKRLRDIFRQVAEVGGWRGEILCRRSDGSLFPTEVSLFPIYDAKGVLQGNAGIIRDISAEKQAEEEQIRLREQVIEAQRAMLQEVSTPLMPLSENILAMPLVGTIDTTRAQLIMETLLEGITIYQADVAILDITGVRVMDTQVAHALMRTARAVRLLGARVVLTGIKAEVAQTLARLEADLGDIITVGTIQDGIEWAMMYQA